MQFLLWTWTWICRRRQPPVRAVPTSTQTVGTQTSSSTWLPDADTCSLTLLDADTSSSTWSVLPEDAPVLPDADTSVLPPMRPCSLTPRRPCSLPPMRPCSACSPPTQRMQLPPEPEPDAIVYIAQKAGKRWHSVKGCSHAYVPVPYAQARIRFTPCKKCA